MSLNSQILSAMRRKAAGSRSGSLALNGNVVQKSYDYCLRCNCVVAKSDPDRMQTKNGVMHRKCI